MLHVIKQKKVAFSPAVTLEFYEKKERGNSNNMHIFGQNHSEIEENLSSHNFEAHFSQARIFTMFFYMPVIISLYLRPY